MFVFLSDRLINWPQHQWVLLKSQIEQNANKSWIETKKRKYLQKWTDLWHIHIKRDEWKY